MANEQHGLFRLYPRRYEPASCDLDIVAVHGLGGHPFRTWTDKDGHLWLQDSLPGHIPRSRVLSFGYDSAPMFRRTVMKVGDFAEDLLTRLCSIRKDEAEKLRPLLFICHSLGGIVVKQALVLAALSKKEYGDIKTATRSIAFFGTPHRGSKKASSARILARIFNAVTLHKAVRTDVLRTLEYPSHDLDNLNRLSQELLLDVNIVSFYEQRTIGGNLIVEPYSAILSLPNQRAIPVNADHRGIARVSPRKEHRYQPIWTSIKELADISVAEHSQSSELDELRSALFCIDYKVAQLRPSIPHPGTCDWILEDDVFKTWLERPSSSLFLLSGPPGSGKSVLARFVIEEVLAGRPINADGETTQLCASFFCSFSEVATTTEELILRSFLHQLLQLNPNGHVLVRSQLLNRLSHKTSEIFDLDVKNLWKAMKDILSMNMMRNVLVVIDGIEELGTSTFKNITSGFSRITDALNKRQQESGPRLKVLFSSRSQNRTRAEFPPTRTLQLSKANTDEGIRRYITTGIETLARADKNFDNAVGSTQKQDIINKILTRANGMFLWAVIAWDDFKRCLLWNEHAIERKLRDLDEIRPGINTLYDRMVSQVDPEYQKEMWAIFSILAVAKRPLSEAELGVLLAFSERREIIPFPCELEPLVGLMDIIEKHFPDMATVRDDGSITFTHLSVKEYLLDKWQAENAEIISKADRTVAVACIAYVKFHAAIEDETYDDVVSGADGATRTETSSSRRAMLWGYVNQFLIDHLISFPAHDPLWLEFGKTAHSTYFRVVRRGSSPIRQLLYASYDLMADITHAGCVEVVERLVEAGYDLNEGASRTRRGAILNYCCSRNTTAYGSMAIVLLRLGANPNFYPEGYTANLRIALETKQQDLYQAIIRHPAFDAAVADQAGQISLHYLTVFGDEATVSAFLDAHDVDVNTQDKSGSTPLHLAVAHGRISLIQRLLSVYGVRLDLTDHNNRTPLTLAMYWGLKVAAITIISPSQAFPIPEVDRINAIVLAARHGDEDVAQALLPNTRPSQLAFHMDESGKTFLHHAAANDWASLLEQVFSRSGGQLNPNQLDHSGSTALHYAAKLGCTASCEILRKHGATMRLQDRNGRTALHVAADAGFKDTLMALLRDPAESAIDVNQRDHQGRNLLHWAATLDFLDVMKTLCDMPGAEIARRDSGGKMPIDHAYTCQCPVVGQYLSVLMRVRGEPPGWTDWYDWAHVYEAAAAKQARNITDEEEIAMNPRHQEWDAVQVRYPPAQWALVSWGEKPAESADGDAATSSLATIAEEEAEEQKRQAADEAIKKQREAQQHQRQLRDFFSP